MANLKYFLWLTTRKGLRPGEPWDLLSRFGTAEAVFFAERPEYELLGLPEAKLRSLEDKDLSGAEKIMEDCDRLGIHILTAQDADYPELLGRIDAPPAVLYWKGRALAVDDRLTIAVVGTRKSTSYGDVLAGRLGLELVRSGAVLVSGMAEGIDSAGLRGALKGGGTVVSVLGGGIDIYYPYENRWLYEDVAASGTLVSEYPPGTAHKGVHFPVRNRILSGLSRGVAVVEAGIPSGSLITAHLALDQGREVFAFPGPIGAPASLGTNKLIQDGEAKLIRSAADILEEFSDRFEVRRPERSQLEEDELRQRLSAGRPARTEGGKKSQKSPPPAEKEVDKLAQRAYISLTDAPEALTDDERDVLLSIRDKALTADDVAEAAQLPARRVLSALTMLQLRGWVEEKPGKRFTAAVTVTP